MTSSVKNGKIKLRLLNSKSLNLLFKEQPTINQLWKAVEISEERTIISIGLTGGYQCLIHIYAADKLRNQR
jgi:hypothetical protein